MATSVEDIVNMAAREVGYQYRLGSIYDGSELAKTALELYGETRDELLRELYPEFCRRANVALVLLKGPPPSGGFNLQNPWSPAYAPPPWLYEYQYPTDAIEVRAVIRQPQQLPERDPRPAVFRIDWDGIVPGVQVTLGGSGVVLGGVPVTLGPSTLPTGKVVLTNVSNALVTYCGRVTNPTAFNALFTRQLVTALARKFAVPLVGNVDLMKVDEQIAQGEAVMEMRHRG